jgi:SNF family Na+-dependent transporter
MSDRVVFVLIMAGLAIGLGSFFSLVYLAGYGYAAWKDERRRHK